MLNAFKSAPKFGEEGYYRMIIVATSAFGLGVDRPDVAAVLCLSPPADLAALYQQLGRAGRGLAQGTEEKDRGRWHGTRSSPRLEHGGIARYNRSAD